MNALARFSTVALCLLAPGIARAGVVINEIFYNPPEDIPKLQWVELHNPDDQVVELSGWKLAGGATFTFAPGSRIEPQGYVVICEDEKRFHEYYAAPVVGAFKGSLTKSGRTVELLDAAGKTVDGVKFGVRAPWPITADGYTASLERISPKADGMLPANWTASPTTDDDTWPSGSPGARNSAYCGHLPPVVSKVTYSPVHPKPGEPIEVVALVEHPQPLGQVELRFRTVKPGAVSEETVVPMRSTDQKRYVASIPPRERATLVRFRVRASDQQGGERSYPAASDLRPALSVYVEADPEVGAIPFAAVINAEPKDVAASVRYIQRSKSGSDNPFSDGKHAQALQMVSSGLDLGNAWTRVTLQQAPDAKTFRELRKIFLARAGDRQRLLDEVGESNDIEPVLRKLPDQIAELRRAWTEEIAKALPAADGEAFRGWVTEQTGSRQRGPDGFFRQFVKIEGLWLALNQRFELSDDAIARMRPILKNALEGRSSRNPALQSLSPGAGSFTKLQEVFGAVENKMWDEMRPVLTFPQMRYARQWSRDHGSFIRPRMAGDGPLAPRGRSAFVLIDPRTRTPEVFDFVNVTERSAGYKVRFHKDHRLRGEIATANLLFEYNDRFVLAEPLAYELYRRAGSPSPDTDFVRLSLDGKWIGYHLLTEQINGSFLRRHQRDSNGDLFKIAWYGRSIESQHEKQKRPETGHKELLELIDRLNHTKGDEQWAVIEKNFNVDQVINYFVVNMCLSHWDGFFNNYFAYHDKKGSGKWEMYPWDQDKTWGYYDNIKPGEVFFDMPLTYGMEGDTPPGGGPAQFDPSGWWRSGGFFSKPLLANPEFRRRFLARTREVLNTQFKAEVMFPVIDAMAARLRDEVPIRAAALGEDKAVALKRLDENIASLKENLTKRREFLLAQAELK